MTTFSKAIIEMAGAEAPIDSHIEGTPNTKKVTSLSTKVNKTPNTLHTFNPEVQEDYYELHGVHKCYK